MQRSTELTFYVAEHYLAALINFDYSGLENDEIGIVEGFYNEIHAQTPNDFEWGHLSVTNEQPEFRVCEASEKLANCVEVTAIYWNKKA